MSILPLEGIRVINFGAAAAAPAVGAILGEFGAEVIKVESRGRPDMLRYVRPLVTGVPPEDVVEVGGLYADHNQCTKSILANLKNPKAIDLLKKLISKSDVVLDNFSPRVMPGLGLSYEDLKKVKPDIICASMSAVGATGPLSHMLAYAPTIGALCGIDSMIGYPDGEKAIDNFAGDYLSAITSAMLIMAAVRFRNRTGKGQFIDLGELEPTVYTLGEPVMDYVMNGRVAGKQGNWRTGFCPCNAYPAKGNDQWITIQVKTEDEWQALCKVMGNPSWAKEDRFADRSKRVNNQAELDKLIGQWTKNMTSYEAMFLLQAAGVAAIPYMAEDLFITDPHWVAREVTVKQDTAKIKGIDTVAVPVKLSETPGRNSRAPMLGEHTDQVYGEIVGLSRDEIESLKKEGAIT